MSSRISRLVAGRQEARQAGRDHDRIAHDHVGLGMADAVRRPGDRHDADGAVELRDVEADGRLAVARRAAPGRRRRRPASRVGGLPLHRHLRAVAAGAERAGGAERAVDQAAVEVAHLEAELALAEIPGLRIGRLVVGQVEDADVDGGDRDIGLARRRQRRRPRPGSTAAGAAASCAAVPRRRRRASARRDRPSAISRRWRACGMRVSWASPGRNRVAVT